MEQINDPSHPIDLRMEWGPVVASDFPVKRGKPLIPRSFLEGCETEKKKEIKSKPSFAAKTQPAVDFVDVSKLPDPSLEGERPHIKIAQDAYLRGLDYCKHSLIGRLNLSKIPIQRVRKMAKLLWKPTGAW